MADDNNTSSGAVSFTEAETTLVVAIMKHLTSEIQFDAQAIAAELGYKDGNIVKTRWRQIKTKKLSGAAGAAGAPNGGIKKRGPATKKTTKKTDKGENGGGGEEEVDEASPSKKKRGRKAEAEKEDAEGSVKIKAEEGEDVVESMDKED